MCKAREMRSCYLPLPLTPTTPILAPSKKPSVTLLNSVRWPVPPTSEPRRFVRLLMETAIFVGSPSLLSTVEDDWLAKWREAAALCGSDRSVGDSEVVATTCRGAC